MRVNGLTNVHDGFDDAPEDENVASTKDASQTEKTCEEEEDEFHCFLGDKGVQDDTTEPIGGDGLGRVNVAGGDDVAFDLIADTDEDGVGFHW